MNFIIIQQAHRTVFKLFHHSYLYVFIIDYIFLELAMVASIISVYIRNEEIRKYLK